MIQYMLVIFASEPEDDTSLVTFAFSNIIEPVLPTHDLLGKRGQVHGLRQGGRF